MSICGFGFSYAVTMCLVWPSVTLSECVSSGLQLRCHNVSHLAFSYAVRMCLIWPSVTLSQCVSSGLQLHCQNVSHLAFRYAVTVPHLALSYAVRMCLIWPSVTLSECVSSGLISGFRHRVDYIFALLWSYAKYIDSWRRSGTTYLSHLVSSWTAWPVKMVPMVCPLTSVNNTSLRRVRSQKSEYLTTHVIAPYTV
jgi:hypothetical protein